MDRVSIERMCAGKEFYSAVWLGACREPVLFCSRPNTVWRTAFQAHAVGTGDIRRQEEVWQSVSGRMQSETFNTGRLIGDLTSSCLTDWLTHVSVHVVTFACTAVVSLTSLESLADQSSLFSCIGWRMINQPKSFFVIILSLLQTAKCV